MKWKKISKKVMSLLLVFSIIISLVACSSTTVPPSLSDPNEQVINENIIEENIIGENVITENTLTEFITSEIYLEEIVIAENKITELLLEEEIINEVMSCKIIYVPQDNIDEFSANSQTAQLFGDDVAISSLLTKVAVGTGVIVTVTILKKVGLPDPIASVVVAAADKSLKFAETGAAIGSLFGGLTGAADEIDSSGRLSAFATAAFGLILTVVSLVAEVPSGGSTTFTAAAGIKLVIAGVSVLVATAGTAYAGYQAVKTYTSTDSADIDWKNIDWEKVGVSAAEKAVQNGADGYMWGSIVGTVYGGVEGYDFYQKYNTPYSEYNDRRVHTPTEGGKWSGDRGESDFILDEPIELSDETKITKVTYKNAVPDFSPYQKAQVKIPNITDNRYQNFKQANEVLAEYWSKIKYNGQTWTARDIEIYRSNNHLTWHEMNNMELMQLVPYDVNARFTHLGGVGEYNAMIGQKGVVGFD